VGRRKKKGNRKRKKGERKREKNSSAGRGGDGRRRKVLGKKEVA